jgi:tetratricopeptide (TPR) repeat protein
MTRRCLCLLVLLGGLALGPAAAAQDCAAGNDAPGLSESVYRQLERASEAIEAGESAEAVTALDKLVERVDGYARAVALQTRGYAHAEAGDDARALSDFQQALAMEALPRAPQQQLRYNTGQLQIASGDVDAGIKTLQAYFEAACEPPPPRAHMLLASAYAEQERYRDALGQVEQALARSEGEVAEDWLRFKLGLHFELAEYGAAAEVLKILIARAPREPRYWRQLVGAYFEDGQRRRALAAQALSERLGLLTEPRELRNLASLYQALEIPWKAARLLREALDDGRLPGAPKDLEQLANAWVAAREWAEADAALLAAAEAASDARLFVRLGQVRMERGRWAAAASAFERALARGAENASRVHYQLGIAAWRAGDADRARSALQRAAEDTAQRDAARQWLDYIARRESA